MLIKTIMPEDMYKLYTYKRWIISRHPRWADGISVVMHKCKAWSLRYEVVLRADLGGTCLNCKKKAPEKLLTLDVLFNFDSYSRDY